MFAGPLLRDVDYLLVPGCAYVILFGREPERELEVVIFAVRRIFVVLEERLVSLTNPFCIDRGFIPITLGLHCAGQFYSICQLLIIPVLLDALIVSIDLKLPLSGQ